MSSLLNRLAARFVSLLARVSPFVGRATVPEISTSDLQELLKQRDEGKSVVLVDVRSPAETNVSVIPSAITVEQFETDRQKYSDHQVVAYCTVGGRSLIYAQKLAADGINASNYRPSILGWCESQLPLVTLDGQETNRVHTYSAKFKVPDNYEAIPKPNVT